MIRSCSVCGVLEFGLHKPSCMDSMSGIDLVKSGRYRMNPAVTFGPSGHCEWLICEKCGKRLEEGGLICCPTPEEQRGHEEFEAGLRGLNVAEGAQVAATAALVEEACSVCGGPWRRPEGRCYQRCWRAVPLGGLTRTGAPSRGA